LVELGGLARAQEHLTLVLAMNLRVKMEYHRQEVTNDDLVTNTDGSTNRYRKRRKPAAFLRRMTYCVR
jgi:hypothetical protein